MNVTTTTTSYQGNPTLEFTNGSGRPFSLGAYKLRVILTALPDVRSWLGEQGEDVPSEATAPPAIDKGTVLGTVLARLDALETAPPRPAINALVERIEALESTLAIILEEIAGNASPAPAPEGTRSLQID